MPRSVISWSTSTALLIFSVSNAVFACSVTSTEAADRILAESLSSLQFYHVLIVLMSAATIAFFLLRKAKGWTQVVVVLIVLLISPGWFAYQNANITPWCEPAFAFEMKLLAGVVATAFLTQVLAWYWKSRKTLV